VGRKARSGLAVAELSGRFIGSGGWPVMLAAILLTASVRLLLVWDSWRIGP